MLDIERRPLILIVDGWRFHSTSDSRKSLEKTRVNLAINSTLGLSDFKLELFGVDIAKGDPHTLEVREWRKVEGYSLWYRRK